MNFGITSSFCGPICVPQADVLNCQEQLNAQIVTRLPCLWMGLLVCRTGRVMVIITDGDYYCFVITDNSLKHNYSNKITPTNYGSNTTLDYWLLVFICTVDQTFIV